MSQEDVELLVELARDLMNRALDARYDEGNIAAQNELLESAAQAYEDAGMAQDAEMCRLLIEK